VRFSEQVGAKPKPAAQWAKAEGEMTGRLRGHLRQFAGTTLVAAELENRPEPQVLIMFFVDAAQGGSWDMLTKSTEPYNALLQKYHGQVSGVQYGTHQGGPDLYNGLVLRANLPWLTINYEEQARIVPLTRLVPGRGNCALYALSRDGVPILATENPDEAAVLKFFTDVDALMSLLNPASPHAWADRAHFLSALRAEQHKQDSTGPLLVGDPLVARTLRNLHDRGIARVEAKIEVGVDGKVTAATLKEDPAISAKAAAELAKALQQYSVFAPAVDHGQLVAGSYDYAVDTAK
jgi:hypothetical protein